ncbi:MAG TPA: SIR2 family protein [Anaerolineales bacterium]|nr:SIR2 family protein [Anaerolineales bacterium]
MKTQTIASLKPFKFLNHYEFDDREIFFGRERESEILLSDVIATRLVVLFARTGSGKSSLINAGVRPRLEDLDYATFYVRVEKDPIASLRKTLEESKLQSVGDSQRLDVLLLQTVAQLDKPIVVFFDQFEEFFIYVAEDQPEFARQFIAAVAKLYRNRDSGVHLVFSMREEFFVEMDAFRDEIPSIFHSDSHLRLRWFDLDQARDAIILPARRFDTPVEESLVDRLIQDLQQGGRIEPARLQIVCDTLWQQRSDSGMLLADYERLGGSERILDRRLMQDITASFDDEMLELLEKLLPELITERGTKYVRGFEELSKNLQWDPSLLQQLIEQLSALGLVRISSHSGARFFEWTSDYLAERTTKIQERVRTVLLTRRLQAAMDRAKKLTEVIDQNKTGQLTYQERDVLYLSDEEFDTLSKSVSGLPDLDREQLEFLLVAALEHGDHMRRWFEAASARGVPVWEILKNRITDQTARIEQAENALRLLGELKTGPALELLEAALKIDTLSALAVKVLGRIETPGAILLLEKALEQQEELAPEILAVLAQSGNPEAVALLQSALQDDNLARQAERGLDKISKSKSSRAAEHAGQVLDKWKAERQSLPSTPPRRSKGFQENDWANLLRRIQAGKCTPILGPGVLVGLLPSQAEIAKKWAAEIGYPLRPSDDLSQVAQYMSIQYDDAIYPKEKLAAEIRSAGLPDETASDEAHRALAELPLSIYVTTNYDELMSRALKIANKEPSQDLVQWSRFQEPRDSSLANREPTPAEPCVFHLYGMLEQPESLVLTEDDFLDYLVHVERNSDTLPPQVRRALASTSLLFIGFGFQDRSLRVLLRSLVTSIDPSSRRISIATQMVSGEDAEAERLQSYIEYYFANQGIKVYWGSIREFTRELSRRWREYIDAS